MIKIENVEVVGWEHAIRGMRNPMNSWDKSDSTFDEFFTTVEGSLEVNWETETIDAIGPKDRDLMMALRRSGTDHRKFMRMLVVYLDITAPLYWWKEFDTYKVGTVANSCSTMHKIHAKEFDISDFSTEHLIEAERPLYEGNADCVEPPNAIWLMYRTVQTLNQYRDLYLKTKDKKYWWQMIQLLPSSYNQKRTVMLNYEVLANMFAARCNHKLDEWKTLCVWMRTLPYSELITGEEYA